MASTKGLTVGALAVAAGIHLETVRYYERIGLMPPPARTASGYRIYGAEHVRRLSFIRRARELGFGTGEVKALLSLAEPAQASCAQVRALTLAHLDAVRAKISDLRRLEAILSNTVEKCSGDVTPSCPVLDMLTQDG
ncbi:helix-turn-helix domain-containing protein [Inquilinus limosus]|uniref:MerR family transcriptional regulator n=1 Tax=Inquilinus limosus TaxID=171674 RepID=UPI003F16FA3B